MERQVYFESDQNDALHMVQFPPYESHASVHQGRELFLRDQLHPVVVSIDIDQFACLRHHGPLGPHPDRHGQRASSGYETIQDGQVVQRTARSFAYRENP